MQCYQNEELMHPKPYLMCGETGAESGSRPDLGLWGRGTSPSAVWISKGLVSYRHPLLVCQECQAVFLGWRCCRVGF